MHKDAVRSEQANKISLEDKTKLMNIINSSEYQDLPACKIIPLLADKNCYIASESTVYRLMRLQKQLKHRTKSKPARLKKPDPFVATGPNQVWSWDISYLPTTVKGLYFYLYLVMDIYSRKIVAWSIHDCQCSYFASKLIKQGCLDEKIEESQLVLHSDNGKPMKGVTMLAMLENLGVTPSFSRPSVSDDNPYSESLFKTVKYHSSFPCLNKFDTLYEARSWMIKFTKWYNNAHLHSAIKYVTPDQRHCGLDKGILKNRHIVYQEAKKLNPSRWSGKTRNWEHIDMVYLNPGRIQKNGVTSVAA